MDLKYRLPSHFLLLLALLTLSFNITHTDETATKNEHALNSIMHDTDDTMVENEDQDLERLLAADDSDSDDDTLDDEDSDDDDADNELDDDDSDDDDDDFIARYAQESAAEKHQAKIEKLTNEYADLVERPISKKLAETVWQRMEERIKSSWETLGSMPDPQPTLNTIFNEELTKLLREPHEQTEAIDLRKKMLEQLYEHTAAEIDGKKTTAPYDDDEDDDDEDDTFFDEEDDDDY